MKALLQWSWILLGLYLNEEREQEQVMSTSATPPAAVQLWMPQAKAKVNLTSLPREENM